jgi:putative hydrolase of the HAD superfamily
MIKAVIFDWGGVVAPDSDGGWMGAFARLTGLEGDELKSVWSYAYKGLSTGAINFDVFWQRVYEKTGKVYPDNKNSIWKDGLVREPWPAVIEYAESLRSKGIRTAVLSNSIEYIESMPWFPSAYEGFEPIIFSHQVGLAKPDLSIYELMLQKLGLRGDECIFIDDIDKNLPPAGQLGMKTILSSKTPEDVISGLQKALQDPELR